MDISPIASPLVSYLSRKFIKNPTITNPVDPLNVEYLVLDEGYGLLDSAVSREIGTVGVYGGEVRRDFTYDLPNTVEPIVRNGRLVILDRTTGREKDVTLLYHYSRESIRGAPNPAFPFLREDGVIEHWQNIDRQRPGVRYISRRALLTLQGAALRPIAVLEALAA